MVVVELSGLFKLSSVVFGGFSQVVISNSHQGEPEFSIGLRVFDQRWIVKVFHVHVASSSLSGRLLRLMRGGDGRHVCPLVKVVPHQMAGRKGRLADQPVKPRINLVREPVTATAR